MKRISALLVLGIVALVVVGCGAKATPDSVYLWKPEAKEDRYLKAEYVTDLRTVIKNLGEYGHKLQPKGVGFTTHYRCELGNCTPEENAQHWMFTVLEQKTVNSEKYKTYSERMTYIVNKKLQDILFALKTDFLLTSKNKINGVVIGLIWSEKKMVKEMVKKPRFEFGDVYIDMDTFQAYQNRTLSFETLLNKAVYVNNTGDQPVQAHLAAAEEKAKK